jgi:hypothetical protein
MYTGSFYAKMSATVTITLFFNLRASSGLEVIRKVKIFFWYRPSQVEIQHYEALKAPMAYDKICN